MVIKAVIFDIGGVVVGSPVAAISRAEQLWNLPRHYLNSLITAYGDQGAFQRLERGELGIEEFYREFGNQLSDVERGNSAFRTYCKRVGMECPELPKELKIDGKELWSLMMDPATEPDPLVVTAINRLRASGRYKIAALTNNFAPSSGVPQRYRSTGSFREITTEELRSSLKEAAREESDSKGAGDNLLKSLFDEYIESCIEGLRKPDPRFFQLALDKLGIKPEEAVFLDDIGHNLIAARKLGIRTIRVVHGQSEKAIKELESVVDLRLLDEKSKL
ncbi:HAD family hydrolase [Sporobolomyces salmoneus]|uniref:HAD family hydrolase n=1 Tax=Sporobolomyces salmoneus TaxID=183962 RepID=UPI00316C1A14